MHEEGPGPGHQERAHGLQSQVFQGQDMEQVQGKVCQELLLVLLVSENS